MKRRRPKSSKLHLLLIAFLIFPLYATHAGLKSRWTPPKPEHAYVGPNDFRECVTVKFIEGSVVRLMNDKLVSLAGEDLSEFHAAIQQFKIRSLERLFPRAENLLEAERRLGQERSGKELADLNNYYRVILDPRANTEAFIDALNALPVIETAYAVPRPFVAEDIPPETPDLSDGQGYLYEAPGGINAPVAWEFDGGTGEGIKIIDIEGGWHFDHEDLKEPFHLSMDNPLWLDHGDAVVGVLVGGHNEYGINGICPDAEIGGISMTGLWPDNGWPNVASVINAAAEVLDEGDFFLIELHNEFQGQMSPMETWQENFDAIETASANGITCVEAAGNGNSDLDHDRYEGRFDPENRHSGAILVGAGAPPSGNFGPDRSRLDFSNYGQRVDLQGWGYEVTTAGYGDLFYPNNDQLQWYTSVFGGTSSATPIVGGSAVCVQGIYKANTDGEAVLSGVEIRDILVETGTPQSEEGRQGHIGPRPNLEEAIFLLYLPCVLYGSVTDAATGEALAGAMVSTSYGYDAVTDVEGNWRMENARSVIEFSIMASMQSYNDSTMMELQVAEEETLEIDFALLHPEFELTANNFASTLASGEIEQFEFQIINDGNGSLDWWSEFSYAEGAGGFGNMIDSYLAGPPVNDLQLKGVAFAGNRFYVTGQNGNGPNMVYVYDTLGTYLRGYEQVGNARAGMEDLTWDGELIWGSGEQTIWGFNLDGELVRSFEGPFVSNKTLAYDSDRGVMWAAGTSTTILGVDMEGNRVTALNTYRLRVTGMAYWADDPDGYNLYLLHNTGQFPAVHKINIETGDSMFAATLETEVMGQPGGAFMATGYRQFGTVFMTLIDDYLNQRGDRVDVWQVGTYRGWMSLDLAEDILPPESRVDLNLILNSADLFASTYQGEINFYHTAVGGEATIEVTLEVYDPNAGVSTTDPVPLEFGISAAYPNPFNATARLRYSLAETGTARLVVYDINGCKITELINSHSLPGAHEVEVDASNWSSGVYIAALKTRQQVDMVKLICVK